MGNLPRPIGLSLHTDAEAIMADEAKGPDLKQGVLATQLRDGEMIAGQVDGEGVLVARRGGKLFAVSDECTHLGGPLYKGVVVDGEVRCPWHQARFSLETGEAVGAPALQPLGCYAVAERDGKVFVTGKRERAEAEAPGKDPGRVVIVGGGAAGHACADMLTRRGLAKQVTVISADADAPYDRTFCSKQYLSGKAPRTETNLDHNDIYRAGVTLLTGTKVTAVNIDARSVTTDAGETHPYDALVLATGAEPSRPDIAGFDRANVHVLRTLKDADALIEAAGSAKHVAIVGASFIGLEAAAAMIQRRLKVEVIAPEPVPLARTLGEAAGRFVQAKHEERGVVFHLGRKVKGFDGRALTLDDGSTVEADFVILGVGVKPCLDLAVAANLRVADAKAGGGVVVDDHLMTSAPGVYAVGDIAHYPDANAGDIRVEHWVHAERQGQHVARLLMGQAAAYTDTPFFWSAHYDASIRYVGHASKTDGVKVDGDTAKGEFVIRYTEKGKDVAVASLKHDRAALEFAEKMEPPAG